MSNPNAPFGFAPLQTEGKEVRARVYAKATGIIYPGDAVKLQSTGDVAVAAAGDTILGVAAVYETSASTTVKVYDDPLSEFYVQTSGNFVAADVGQNANIVATTGDTTLKYSKNTLDSASQNTTSTLQFKILGLYSKGVNAVGSYAMVRVMPNNHFFRVGVTGV